MMLAFRPIRRAWNDPTELGKLEAFWRRVWPGGESSLQAWLRAGVPLYVAGVLIVLGYPAVLLGDTGLVSRTILTTAATIGFIGAMIMAAIAGGVALLNFPRIFVFPSLRHQEGWLAAWWRSHHPPR